MDEAAKIAELAAASGQASGAAQHLADLLLQAAKAAGNNATAANASAQEMSKQASQAQTLQAGLGGLARNAQGLINSFTGVSSSVYGADKAFTSVIPTLDSLTATATGFIDAIGKLGSGVEVFGVSLGRASEGMAELSKMGLDVVTKGLKFQLEGAQKVTDTYQKLSSIGATFGGSIGEMADSAADTHTPIDEFGKAIAANAESISKLGLGMNRGARVVVGMAKDIYDTNDGLVGLYGNLTELSKGTADFLALQTQLGINVEADYHNQLRYAQEYLLRQKELSTITGKTAETMKREEEGRRKQLDYNLKLGRLGEVAKANVQEGMAMAGKIFGDEGSKYAEEYFATGGKVYSQEALRYQAMNQEAADTISQFMSNVDTDRESYRKNNGQYLKDNASALENWAKSLEDMAEINRNANNPLIKSQTETASSIISNLNFIKNSTDVFAQLTEDRTKLEKGQAPDALTQTFVDAERARSRIQRDIDDAVLTNMSKLGQVIEMLNSVTLGMVKAMGSSNEALLNILNNIGKTGDALTEGVSKFGDKLREEIVRALREAQQMRDEGPQIDRSGRYIRPDVGPISAPGAAPAQMPSTPVTTPAQPNATTGAAQQTTGAATPTAAAPIDISQLVMAMNEQSKLTKDVIRELQDNNDLTKKLIDYTA